MNTYSMRPFDTHYVLLRASGDVPPAVPFCRAGSASHEAGIRRAPFKLRNKSRCLWLARAQSYLFIPSRSIGRCDWRKSAAEGGLLFDFFLLAMQEKEVCCRATLDGFVTLAASCDLHQYQISG